MKLHQCPYCKATKCAMDEGCAGCETFVQYKSISSCSGNCSDCSIPYGSQECEDAEERYYKGF